MVLGRKLSWLRAPFPSCAPVEAAKHVGDEDDEERGRDDWDSPSVHRS